MRYFLMALAAIVVGIFVFGMSSEGRGLDADTGRRCPGKFFDYGCKIHSGSYEDFAVGMSRLNVFEGICQSNFARRFRSIQLTAPASGISAEATLKWKPSIHLYYERYPNGAASFFARSTEEFCALSEIEGVVDEISILYEPFNRPAVLTLSFEDGVIVQMHLADHTIDP